MKLKVITNFNKNKKHLLILINLFYLSSDDFFNILLSTIFLSVTGVPDQIVVRLNKQSGKNTTIS